MQARKRLNRDWLIAAAVAVIVLLGMAQWLLLRWVPETVGRWAVVSGLAIFYELRIFKQVLPLMHRSGHENFSAGIGVGVMLTLFSGLCYALLAGFLLVTFPEGMLGWLPALLATVAIIVDALNGPAARRLNQATAGGAHLAREFRALGTLILTALAIHYGRLDPWFLLIGVMNYLQLFTISWLGRKGKSLHRPPERLQHFLNGLYLVAVSVALWPLSSGSFAVLLGLLFGLPYFLVALRDWFILAGLLDPEQSQYRQLAAAINQALTGWLALSIRLLAAMATATVLADIIFHFDVYTTAFSSDLAAGGLALMLLVALPFLFLGVRARLAALAGFIVFAVILLVIGWNIVIFVGLILLGLTIILGRGQMAIEKDDED